MSVLRSRLNRPEPYLAILGLVLLLGAVDSFRPPGRQVTGHLYINAVYEYQRLGRPLLSGYIRCRYRPTCSVYSAEAVRRWGIRRGLILALRRVASCRQTVVFGTIDPVPAAFNTAPSAE